MTQRKRETAKSEALELPPLSYEIDLKSFPFMPLEVARLRKSKAWLICKRRPDLAFYLINLWTASWHERPPGSLEDDEDVLADFAMCPPERWPDIRDDVLRGWTKCSDGRLYHSVVVEKALDAWLSKLRNEYDRECGRIRKDAERKGLQKPVFQTFEDWSKRRMSAGHGALSSGHGGSVHRTASDVGGASTNCPRENAITEQNRTEHNRTDIKPMGRKSARGRTPARIDKHGLNGHADDFEAIKRALPKRRGSHRWTEAATEYRARLAEGHTHAQILAGAERFAAYIRSARKEDTQYVMQAKTFLGPALEFLSPWDPVRTEAEVAQDANVSAAQQWLAGDDDAKH